MNTVNSPSWPSLLVVLTIVFAAGLTARIGMTRAVSQLAALVRRRRWARQWLADTTRAAAETPLSLADALAAPEYTVGLAHLRSLLDVQDGGLR